MIIGLNSSSTGSKHRLKGDLALTLLVVFCTAKHRIRQKYRARSVTRLPISVLPCSTEGTARSA